MLDASQTPAGLAKEEDQGYSRIDFYLEQVLDCLPVLGFIRHFVADGYYAKEKVFRVFAQVGKHLITKLRSDADLYFLWQGSRKPGQRGATRKYDGKVDFKDLSRWQKAKTEEETIQLYGQRLYCKRFKQTLLVVLVLNVKTNKYVLLASTDLEQDAQQVLDYYRLRFQIEFIFRDAKQFMGLTQCQARDEDKIDFHINLSLSAVNVARLALQQDASYANSINAFIRRQTNQRIAQLIYEQLSQQPSLDPFDLNTLNLQHWPNKAA